MEQLASAIWNELRRYISAVDKSEAAEILVSILIDNDSDVDSIKSAFKGDSDIKQALALYLDQNTAEEEDEEDYDEDESNWDN